jgi:hypothetical protein
MQVKHIDNGNRVDIQRRYIDHILGSLDFMEIKDKLRDYLELEKDRESDRSLEAEITHEAPDILVDNWEDFDEPATLTKGDTHHA